MRLSVYVSIGKKAYPHFARVRPQHSNDLRNAARSSFTFQRKDSNDRLEDKDCGWGMDTIVADV